MKLNLDTTLIICFLLLSQLSLAQDKNDQILAESKMLFPEFTEGTLFKKDGSTAYAKFNYDNELDQMQFIGPKDQVYTITEPENVQKLVIGDRTFVYLKNYFAELISEGKISVCLRLHLKGFANKVGAYDGVNFASSIQSYSTYNTPEGWHAKLSPSQRISYKMEHFYYLMFNGKVKMVANRLDLLNCFPSHKTVLKKELDKQHVRFDEPDSFKQFVDWMIARGIRE